MMTVIGIAERVRGAGAAHGRAPRRCLALASWILCGSLAHCCVDTRVCAENWPQWRGPRGTGVSHESAVPVFWNEEREIAWKCPLPAWGNSTPVVWDDAVFVTSHTDDGRLLLLHIGARSGTILWTQQVGMDVAPRGAVQRKEQHFHALHNLASPSPVTNGKVVVAHFGNGDLAAYDFQGAQLWKRNLQADYGPYVVWYGHANSPVIFDDMVISICLQDSLTDLQDEPVGSYLVAHDLATGRQRWKTLRMTGAPAEEADAYTTPLQLDVAGQPQLVIMGGNQLDAYDPRTGKQLWFLPGLTGGRTVASPTVLDDTLFATRGKAGPLLALPVAGGAPGGETVERARREILWTSNQGSPDACSPVAHALLLFTVTDDGMGRCYDTKTGKLKWRERLPGNYKASPVLVQGRVLFLNTTGLCTVVSAASRFDKLVENQLDDETLASPAIANQHIYLRGRKTLYCIGRDFR
jgi:outer membrane protein assembly factor BamB